MKLSFSYPPNIDKIRDFFGAKNLENAVYTYGDTVYMPKPGMMPSHLVAHEEVHIKQQAEIGADAWWDKYISDPQFRLEQEVEAYRAQVANLHTAVNRKTRREIIDKLAKDLSGPMYARIIDKKKAKEMITNE